MIIESNIHTHTTFCDGKNFMQVFCGIKITRRRVCVPPFSLKKRNAGGKVRFPAGVSYFCFRQNFSAVCLISENSG